MAILDNENVSFIKLNGSEVYLVKLDGNILYKKTPLYVPYEFRDNSTITKVETIVNDTHSDLSYMFYNCISLVSANTIDWDTSKVTDMSYMFANCDSLTELDLSNFDTSNVKYTEYMFVGCNLLTKVNLNNWDLTNVSDAGYMFNSYCESLVELRLDNCNFETLKWIVTSSLYPKDLVNGEKRKMYLKKENITSPEGYKLGPPSGWQFVYVSDTEEPVDPEIPPVEPEEPETPLDEFKGNDTITEVQTIVNETHTDLSCMFEGCTALTTVNTTDWDTSNVTNMSRMFYGCNNICDLEVNNWDTSKVTDMSYMFYDCFDRAVSALDLSNWNTSEVTNMDSMFCACNKLQYLDISNFDLTKVTNTDNMLAGSLLDSFSKLRLDNCDRNTIEKIITSEGFPTSDYGTHEIYVKLSRVSDLTPPDGWIFVEATEEEPVVPEIPTEPEKPVDPEIPLYELGEFEGNDTITEVRTMVDSTHTDLSYMFRACLSLISVNTEDWDVSNVTNMEMMFIGCDSLASVDLSDWNMSKVTSTQYMFHSCDSLISLDLSGWNNKKYIDMQSMFYDCISLTYLNLSNLDASQANVSSMLSGCNKLHTLRLDNCNADTIYKIIRNAGLPTTLVNGKTRKIYCKKENKPALSTGEPVNWEFIYVD